MANNAIQAALEAAQLSSRETPEGLFVDGDPEEIAGKLSDVLDEMMLDPESDIEGFLQARGGEVWHSTGILFT